MQVTGISAGSTPAVGKEFVITKGQPLPEFSAQGINDPAPRFMRVYSNEMFSLLGLIGMSYSSSAYDQIKLRFQNYDLAKLADGVLKDSVLGANIVMSDRNGTPYDMTKDAADWVSYPTNFARQVAAMPGVSGYKWHGNKAFLFATDSIDTRVKLQQLVDRKLDGKWTGYWKGECFGPGCKPDPAPPTGEV